MRHNKYLFILSAFFISLTCNNGYSAQLSSTEQQVRNYAIKSQEAELALLEKLVNTNSGSTNITGIHDVGEQLRPELEKLGFKTYWVEQPPEKQRAGILFATHSGRKDSPGLLLIGHLDTVFPKNSTQKFVRQGNKAYGPGIIDDKGGDVVMLYALKSLQEANVLNDANITVALVGDEEDSGLGPAYRDPLKEAARNAKMTLDFEPSVTLNTATIARRGINDWTITTSGIPSHSAGMFQKGSSNGAILEIAQVINSIRDKFHKQKYLTFNPGIILGGLNVNYDKDSISGEASGKNNIIAKTAVASGDFRFLTESQKIKAKKLIETILKKHLPGTAAQVEFKESIPPLAPTSGNINLFKKLNQASIDLGYGKMQTLDVLARGGADIAYVAKITPQNLSGLGPVGDDEHTIHESLNIDSLPVVTARTALLIYRLTTPQRGKS